MKRQFLLWLLLFFMTTNDLTVVFSPGQGAGTLVFRLKRPLSSFVMILILAPPLCMFSPHKSSRARGRGLIYFLVSNSWNPRISCFSVACPVHVQPISTAGEVRKATEYMLYLAQFISGLKSDHSEGQWSKPELGTRFLSFDQCSQIPVN